MYDINTVRGYNILDFRKPKNGEIYYLPKHDLVCIATGDMNKKYLILERRTQKIK